jgi:hypothetical protein
MKKVRIGFAALIAIAAMSFTIASHSKAFEKRVSITNCYKTKTTANYLSSCVNPPIWTAIDCTNKGIGQVLKNDQVLGNFSTTSVTCNGGSTFCCINFSSTTIDPCTFATTLEQTGNNSLKDLHGNTIAGTGFVIVNAVECKP